MSTRRSAGRPTCDRIPTGKRPDALYCCDSHRLAYHRSQNDPANAPARPDKRKRNGTGISIYLSKYEASELAAGRVPPSVVLKAQAKLKPADPIPGQQSIYDVLTEEHDASATAESEAPAS